jgi:transposase
VKTIGDYMTIKELLSKGHNKSQIASRLGMDRKTVRKYADMSGEEYLNSRLKAKKRFKKSKLDPYKEKIQEWLYGEGIRNSRIILERLYELGYTGRQTILLDYLKPLRDEEMRKVVIRFERMGQAQVDWAYFGRLPEGERLYCFTMILTHSRYRYMQFTTRMDLETLLECHQDAFRYFGGVPETILYDNMKQVVKEHPRDRVIFQSRFLEFALFCGFTPEACWPYRAQTKGKIERAIGYIRQNFWPRVKDKGYLLEMLNEAAWEWLAEVANARENGTTHCLPREKLREEPLIRWDESRRYDTSYSYERKVDRESMVSFKTNHYSVPPEYVGKKVNLRVNVQEKELRVVHHGQEITRHTISPDKYRHLFHPEHWQAIVRQALRGKKEIIWPRKQAKPTVPVVEVRDLSIYEEVGYGSRAN